jgi:hypothetical protein
VAAELSSRLLLIHSIGGFLVWPVSPLRPGPRSTRTPGRRPGQATVALSTGGGGTWTAGTLPTNIPLLRAVSCAAGTSACRAAGTSAIVGIG